MCSERQSTLDGSITRQPRAPPFTSLGMLDYLVELVVSEDDVCIFHDNGCLKRTLTIAHRTLQAFQLVDKESFHRLLIYLRPSLADKDIPHRTKLRKEISDRAEAVEKRIRDKLQVRVTLFLCTHL